MTAETISETQSSGISFIIRYQSDDGFELLNRHDQWRVKEGEPLIIYDNGEVGAMGELTSSSEQAPDVLGQEISVFETMTIPAGTFLFIKRDYEAPIRTLDIEGREIRIADVSEYDRKLASLKSKLNGSTDRLMSLIEHSMREGLVNGTVRGVQVLDGGNVTIFGVQSGDPDESTRVSGYFTLPENGSDLGYFLAGSRYNDSRKTINRLEVLSFGTKIRRPN